MNKIIRELKKHYESYENYIPFTEIEIQLDIDKVVVLSSVAYKDERDSDFEMVVLGDFKVKKLKKFIDKLEKTNVYKTIILSDTTEGNYRHEKSLQDTLGKHSHLFMVYCGSRAWRTLNN